MAAGQQPSACPLPNLGPATYAAWRASELGTITEGLQHALLLRLAGEIAGARVLDIGCGDGTLAVELARRGAQVCGIDASREMIEAARARAAREDVSISLEVASADALPLPDASIDLVVAMTVLCFVADAAPVFREATRVLKPGGRLVIGELNKWSLWAAERRVRAWRGSALWRLGRFRTPRELRALARGAGLEPGPVVGAVYYPRSARAARRMRPLEPPLARITTLGAAFLALSATKPA